MTQTQSAEKSRKATTDEITAVPLSNRREYENHVCYDALSRDGVTIYAVTLTRDGKATWCTCPATVKCRHMKAAEFEMEWTKPVTQGELVAQAQQEIAVAAAIAPAILGEFAQDLEQHVEETLSEVLVYMDMDGFYGLVLISGQPSQYLYITEIREQYPVHRVISLEELALFKQQEAEKYRAQYPDDFYFAA